MHLVQRNPPFGLNNIGEALQILPCGTGTAEVICSWNLGAEDRKQTVGSLLGHDFIT